MCSPHESRCSHGVAKLDGVGFWVQKVTHRPYRSEWVSWLRGSSGGMLMVSGGVDFST